MDVQKRRIIDKRSPKGGGGGTTPKGGGSPPKKGGGGGGTPAKAGGNNNPAKVQQKLKQNQGAKQNAGVTKLQNTGVNKLQNTGAKTKTDTTALLAAGGRGTKVAGGGGGGSRAAQAGGKRGAADLKLQVAEVSDGLASINGKKPNQIVKEVDRILSIEKAEDTARGAIKSAKPNDREVTSALATVKENGPKLIKGLEKLKDVANDPKSTRKAIDDQLAEVNKLRKPLLGANTELIKEGQQV